MGRIVRSFACKLVCTAASALTILLMAGCSDPSGPSGDRFDFVSSDHDTDLLLGLGVVINGGAITIGPGDTIEQRLTLACGAESPGCEVPSGWKRLQGVLDRAPVTPAGDMLIEWASGQESLLRLAGDTAWVGHRVPPSHGFAGQAVLRFER